MIVTLVLGIGANLTMFTLMRAVLWRPLPYPQPNRIVVIQEMRAMFPTLALRGENCSASRSAAARLSGSQRSIRSMRTSNTRAKWSTLLRRAAPTTFFRCSASAPYSGGCSIRT